MAASLVQSVAGNHTGANTATVLANISATAAGNLFVVYAIGSQITAVTYAVSVTGGTSQTFTAWPNSPNIAQTGLNLNCWYVLVSASGTTQITITRSSGTGQSAVIVEEWTGGSFAVGVGATASATLTTTLASGTTASQTADLVLACLTDSLGTSQATLSGVTNGFTAQTLATGDNAPTNTAFKGLQSLNKISPATGALSTAMTASATEDAVAGMILGFTLGSATPSMGNAPMVLAPPRSSPFTIRIQRPYASRQRMAYPVPPPIPWIGVSTGVSTGTATATFTAVLTATSTSVSGQTATIYQPGLVVTTETQSGITGGPPGNNTTQTTTTWLDLNGNGWAVGMIPAYGGALIAPWYEIDGGVRTITQTSLATSSADGFIHAFAQSGTPPGPAGVFAGTEDPTFTLTELAPTGQAFRRYYDSGTMSTANPALNWRVRTAIYPGDPGHYYHRIDITNASGSAVNLSGTDGLEIAMLGGMTQANQGGSSAWIPANGVYATVGGSETVWPGPEPTTTVADPDYVMIQPVAGSGLKITAVCVRASTANGGLSIAGLSGASNAQITYLTNTNRLKIKIRVDMTSFPGSTTMTLYYVESRPRAYVAGQAASLAADYLNPDTSAIIAQGTAASPFFSLDEGAYVLAAASGNVVRLTHTFPTNVTKRWTLNYKITGYTSLAAPTVKLGGVLLDNLTALTYVDTSNQIAYVVLMPALVPSGAVAPDRNNAEIIIEMPNLPLAGSSSGLSSSSGTATFPQGLVAASTGSSAASKATMTLAVAMTGAESALSASVATATEAVAVASAGVALSTASGNLTTNLPLAANQTFSSRASGTATLAVALAATAVATGTQVGTASLSEALGATSAATSGMSAALGTGTPLVASLTAGSTGSGSLSLAVALGATATDLSVIAAVLSLSSGTTAISASSQAISRSTATASLSLGLAATSQVQTRLVASAILAVAITGRVQISSVLLAVISGFAVADNVGAYDRATYTVGAADRASITVGAVDIPADSTGAADTIP